MAKIQLKYGKITAFGGLFPIMDEFNRVLSGFVDSILGFRCKLFGYQYSEIIRSIMCVYFCGGTCIEDLSKHLIPCVSQHPKLRTCSSDTILRAIEELTEDNISYTSDNGKTYEFNKAEKLNTLLLEALLTTGQLTKGIEYDFDFDHQFIETEKYDAKTTQKPLPFFLLESCSFKQESCFYPLYRYCPTTVMYLPHNCGEVSPQLWCAFPAIVEK